MAIIVDTQTKRRLSLHGLGVICGLTAAVWLGAAEAPTKLVTAGLSPFAISSAMVCGVFLSRWTFPTLLKGTAYVFADLADKKHLILWALLAGVLWAEGNTLTVFAVRDVGLAEELAQDALVAALQQWPAAAVPDGDGTVQSTSAHRHHTPTHTRVGCLWRARKRKVQLE